MLLHHLYNYHTMNSLLYIIAAILVIGWAFGVFICGLNGIIHILLIMAIIAIVLNIIKRPTAI